MKELLISSLLVLFACASHAQAPRKTGVLREPVQIPLVMNGKQVGTSTVAAGTKVQVVSEANGKVQISISGGEAWVTPEIVDVQEAPLAPVVAAASPKPADAAVPAKEAATPASIPKTTSSVNDEKPAVSKPPADNEEPQKTGVLLRVTAIPFTDENRQTFLHVKIGTPVRILSEKENDGGGRLLLISVYGMQEWVDAKAVDVQGASSGVGHDTAAQTAVSRSGANGSKVAAEVTDEKPAVSKPPADSGEPQKTGVLLGEIQILVRDDTTASPHYVTVKPGTRVQVLRTGQSREGVRLLYVYVHGAYKTVDAKLVDIDGAPLGDPLGDPTLATKTADILYVFADGPDGGSDLAMVRALQEAGYTVATAASRRVVSREKSDSVHAGYLASSESRGFTVDTLLKDVNTDHFKVLFFGRGWFLRREAPLLAIMREASAKHKVIVAEVANAKFDCSYIEELIAGTYNDAKWAPKTLGTFSTKDLQFSKLKDKIIIYKNYKSEEDTDFCNKKIIPAIRSALTH